MNESFSKEKFMEWVRTLSVSMPSSMSVILKSRKWFFPSKKNKLFCYVSFDDKKIQAIILDSYSMRQPNTYIYQDYSFKDIQSPAINLFDLNPEDLKEIMDKCKISKVNRYMKYFMQD